MIASGNSMEREGRRGIPLHQILPTSPLPTPVLVSFLREGIRAMKLGPHSPYEKRVSEMKIEYT